MNKYACSHLNPSIISYNSIKIWIGLLLHTQQLSIRNRGDLGMTVLNNAIAYGMARLANIQPGDVVVDPMAGVGTIPIEASQSWPNAVYYCGDRDKKCVQASQNNMLKFVLSLN